MDLLSAKFEIDGEPVEMDFTGDFKFNVEYKLDCEETITRLAMCGKLLGLLEESQMVTEVECKQWQATTTQHLLDANPKLAEWKVKNQIVCSNKYLGFKKRLAEIKKNIKTMEAVLSAFKHKASMLQGNDPSKG